ncbi:aryl-alcohol oxidase precursor [Armillaria borealis]|uniref:Aryl-alcohol oxidase n=1 Tax=Armillaria borealis TaxID=47425 RepID=A0AA39JTN4_9AGAR|nr:aryl-alcohol oxidase precursor [Armillaria borealis]
MVFLIFLAVLSCTSVLGAIYEKLADLPTQGFNYIIVGGGTAGNVLANRLTEDPYVSVLLLEAGVSTTDVLLSEVPVFCSRVVPGTPWDWNFTTTEQPGLKGRSIQLPRGFGLGESSAVNCMVYTRGSFQDYDRYALVSGDDAWGWDALQPYFRKNERFVAPADNHNVQVNSIQQCIASMTTAELPDEFPFNPDYNSGYQLGIGWTPITTGNGTRSSSQTSYLAPEKENLHGSPVFDAVEFTQDAGASIHTLSLKEIVLSAGSIGTAHILLHSGIGDDADLETLGIPSTLHMPDVGKNLTDHPGWSIMFSVNSTDTIDSTGYLTGGLANQTGFLRVPEDTGVLEGEPCAGSETAHYELIFVNGDFWESEVPETGNFFRISMIVLCPLSRGTVTINSTNPLDPPLINPNYLSHPQDVAIMQYALAIAQKFVTAWEWGLQPAPSSNTASMSPAGAYWGVVDPDLKLKGAEGVRIVDASVMPFVPAGHTQAAVYDIAERATDLIKSGGI